MKKFFLMLAFLCAVKAHAQDPLDRTWPEEFAPRKNVLPSLGVGGIPVPAQGQVLPSFDDFIQLVQVMQVGMRVEAAARRFQNQLFEN